MGVWGFSFVFLPENLFIFKCMSLLCFNIHNLPPYVQLQARVSAIWSLIFSFILSDLKSKRDLNDIIDARP